MLSSTSQQNQNVKSERLEARITSEQKDLIRNAANLSGQYLTDFIICSVQDACYEVIKEHQIINLTKEESKKVAESFSNQSKPNQKLIDAYNQYKDVINNGRGREQVGLDSVFRTMDKLAKEVAKTGITQDEIQKMREEGRG